MWRTTNSASNALRSTTDDASDANHASNALCTTTNNAPDANHASNSLCSTTDDTPDANHASNALCTTTDDSPDAIRATTSNASIRLKLLFNVDSITIGCSTDAFTDDASNAYRSITYA
jgi:hypothetical protein